MPGVKIDSRGLTNVKGNGDLTVSLATIMSGAFNVIGVVTASAGLQAQGPVFVNRISGSAAGSGFLAIGKTATTASDTLVLLEVSGAAGEGKRCAIQLHSTGAVLSTAAGSGGLIGIEKVPTPGSCFIFYDSAQQRLKIKTDNGVQTVHVTGAI